VVYSLRVARYMPKQGRRGEKIEKMGEKGTLRKWGEGTPCKGRWLADLILQISEG